MKSIHFVSRIVLTLFILITTTFGASTDLEMFQHAKKNYVTAVFKNDKVKELKYLKELILYGKKAEQDISKYKKELHRFDSGIENETKEVKNSKNQKINTQEVETIKEKDLLIGTPKNSVYVVNNSLVVLFNDFITKDNIKFKKSKTKDNFTYQIDISGEIDNFSTSKLKLEGVNFVEVVKKKNDLVVINIRNNDDLKVYYALQDKKIIVKVKNEMLDVEAKNDSVSAQNSNKIVKNQSNIVKDDVETNILPKINHNKAKIIVIDAGHGGKDSGAIGANNEKEKDIVLKTTHYLESYLKNLGYVVYLTRSDDTYIPLKERTSMANRKNADLFVSIHANAAPKGRAMEAKGIETYFLSPARSDRAKGVAALENKEDISAMDSYASQDILLTLLNREKTISSQKMAIDIQGHMLHQVKKTFGNDVIDNGVREGPFWVLVGAQMPAVLVEMGYISHPDESQRLIDSKYQQEIASGIAEGITAYFIHNR